MRKPIVGVMPLWDDEKESLWMLCLIKNGEMMITLNDYLFSGTACSEAVRSCLLNILRDFRMT